jgi:cellulose synthase/poly-beta-1,6-N-acetylglucosamine synthase-like glycosyltransferase
MEYPQVSILTPTYNRSKFLPLYVYNIVNQNYPKNKLEVCIYDDGTEPFCNVEDLRRLIYPIKLTYHYNKVKKKKKERKKLN